ncbi:MAG TPA: endonuclease III domain-containing protein [Dissulfurispiraceae bacterium]|nr:endonuclease III domain-containing protein [Dissulfurispiraceae bacterium]
MRQAHPLKDLSLYRLYDRLYNFYGQQHWWPGDTPFEIAVGAILTQNTNWGNVEKAIRNLKANGALNARAIHRMPLDGLATLIRPSGYFNIKAKRLKAFIDYLVEHYEGSMARMKKGVAETLRPELLGINGIGQETADSILLYALDKPVFVIDAYTKRVLSRHELMNSKASYSEYQLLFHSALLPEVRLFNEYHALLVRVGKDYCKPRPQCDGCPLSAE